MSFPTTCCFVEDIASDVNPISLSGVQKECVPSLFFGSTVILFQFFKQHPAWQTNKSLGWWFSNKWSLCTSRVQSRPFCFLFSKMLKSSTLVCTSPVWITFLVTSCFILLISPLIVMFYFTLPGIVCLPPFILPLKPVLLLTSLPLCVPFSKGLTSLWIPYAFDC